MSCLRPGGARLDFGRLLILIPALVGACILAEGICGALLAPDAYRFGSEAMIGNGGWAYRSRGHYLGSALAWGSGLSAIGFFLRRTL